MQISRLRVGNEDFLVASMIERCPKSMMLRDLVKNALEAATNAADGGRRVEIAPLQIDGASKLAIWNSGPGIDAEELFRMCDIASSIGKSNALEQNFGMGAKVASLLPWGGKRRRAPIRGSMTRANVSPTRWESSSPCCLAETVPAPWKSRCG